jgi:potassium voltage-gated channel Shaw-related subfamily C protein
VFLVISLCNFVLETSSFCRIPDHIASNKTLSRRERDQNTWPHPSLTIVESVCNCFFAVEFMLRFISTPSKRRFLVNPYHLMEFLAISPIMFPPEIYGREKTWAENVHNMIEVFYVLRVLRVFTLVPKYNGLRVLLLTLKSSIGELVLYLIILLMSTMIFAGFIYYAEQVLESEDNQFDSILISLWWAIVTSEENFLFFFSSFLYFIKYKNIFFN